MSYIAVATALIEGKDYSAFLSTCRDTIPFLDLGNYLTVFTKTIILIAGLASFIFLLIGGVQYLASGGDKLHVEAARNRISYAIMGLAIVVGAVAVTFVMSTVFGINILGNITWPIANNIVGVYVLCTGT